jgi:hypothetical protein
MTSIHTTWQPNGQLVRQEVITQDIQLRGQQRLAHQPPQSLPAANRPSVSSTGLARLVEGCPPSPAEEWPKGRRRLTVGQKVGEAD